VATGGSHLQGTLGGFLTLDVLEVAKILGFAGGRRLRARQQLGATEMTEDLDDVVGLAHRPARKLDFGERTMGGGPNPLDLTRKKLCLHDLYPPAPGGMRNVTPAKGRWGWVDGDDHHCLQVEKSAPRMGPLFRRKLTSSLTVRTAATGQFRK
jgi:hypothetical protein